MFCRFGYAQTIDLNHTFALRPNLHVAYSMDCRNELFQNSYSRLSRSWRHQRYWSSHTRNLDARGVCVIIVGDKGKGDAEVYDSQDVRYEEWWSKKWGPQLVHTRYKNA